MMPVQQIENLKQNYTDKYVVVDARRPELARFRDQVGQVKTVNMNGRALVQFADYHLNTGWYDIDLGYLKVVEKPEAVVKQPAEKKHAAPAKKAAAASAANGEKKLSPLEMARMQGGPQSVGGAKAVPAGKASTPDILAAARGGAATKAAPSPAAKAPAPPKESAPAAKASPKKTSTADILAMARGKGAAAAVAATAPAKKPAAAPTAPEPEPEPEEAPSTPVPAAKPAAGKIDKSSMTIDQMIAWCREHDAK